MALFPYDGKNGVSIINSIQKCHNENAFKKGKNQDMWLHFYIEDKIGVSIRPKIKNSLFGIADRLTCFAATQNFFFPNLRFFFFLPFPSMYK